MTTANKPSEERVEAMAVELSHIVRGRLVLLSGRERTVEDLARAILAADAAGAQQAAPSGEAVAWLVHARNGMVRACWTVAPDADQLETARLDGDTVTPLYPAPAPAAAPAGWMPIETAPKDGSKLLLFYLNANGKARRVVGGWVTEEEAAETDTDGVGLEAGWYERIDNWPDYYQVAIHEGEPTHWMPLPPPPSQPPSAANEEKKS